LLVAEHDVDGMLKRWTGAGVIDEETAARIRAFELANVGSHRLRWPIWLALGFGATALAAGVMLLVSAHWDDISPASRFGLVLSLVALFHVTGAFVAERFPAMATALHGVGTMALGAGIYLAGQIFNLDEHWPSALLMWAFGAAAAWGILRSWPQVLLTALLAPAWLFGEWMVATEHLSAASIVRIAASGPALLALAYFTAFDQGRVDRKAVIRLGGVALPFALAGLALTGADPWLVGAGTPLPAHLSIIGWSVTIGVPLIVAGLLRGRQAWPVGLAALWVLALFGVRPVYGETLMYVWWAIAATAIAAWGVQEARSERINMGAAIFGATVLAFYFSQVMDKLGRSASLIGLGLVFLAGGWLIERVRRQLALQAQGCVA
jgi:uncharacterized membrane protein